MHQVAKEKKVVTIGDYTLTKKVGQGGAAEIYKARQNSLNRDVAIKILSSKLSDDPEIVRRFERESMVVAGMNHPNVVHVIDKGCAGGRYYFVMEYIDGTSLREVIDSKKLGLNTKLEMIVQVCKALDYAHRNGIIHRDIKPTNVLIDRQGNALVADFGIAQILGTPETEMTATDVIMGTVAYMSPEQKTSSTNVDHTTDIYATGVMLYEILTDKKPLGHFKLPSTINENINQKFDKIVLKCLAQEPRDRYQSAVELKDAILDALENGHKESRTSDFSMTGSESFMGKCRYLDTIKETRFSSTILVENRTNKRLYVIKKHNRGETGRKEANILKSLKNKNIINIFGCGGNTKSTVIISGYAPGGALVDRMVRRYDWEKAIKLMLEVASGLDFAHKNNIVHGNLRPSNILFDADETPKITDFGMPDHYDDHDKKNWYMAPERKKSRSGDIYALGVILYQLISGRNPVYDSAHNLSLTGFGELIPEEIRDMLKKLLAIRVAKRYKTCEEFLLDWEDFDRRREEQIRKRPVVRQVIAEETKKSQIWKYVTVGLVVIVLEIVVLYFAGMLK